MLFSVLLFYMLIIYSFISPNWGVDPRTKIWYQLPVFDSRSPRETYCFAYTWASSRKTCTQRGLSRNAMKSYRVSTLHIMIMTNDLSHKINCVLRYSTEPERNCEERQFHSAVPN